MASSDEKSLAVGHIPGFQIDPKNRKKPNFEVFGKVFDPVIPGMMGVGSPLLYGVTLPLGRPFVTACLGGGFGVLWPAAGRPTAGALPVCSVSP